MSRFLFSLECIFMLCYACVFVKNDNKLLSSELTQLRNSVNQIDIVFLAMNDKKDTAYVH